MAVLLEESRDGADGAALVAGFEGLTPGDECHVSVAIAPELGGLVPGDHRVAAGELKDVVEHESLKLQLTDATQPRAECGVEQIPLRAAARVAARGTLKLRLDTEGAGTGLEDDEVRLDIE